MGRFGQIFKDFSNWSTVAGVPHIANANTKISRIFWIIVFLVMLAMFCYELYIMIAKYLSFPAAVTTDILFEEQDFPVVTICNSNPYKYSVVQSNSAFNDINDLMTIYKQAVAGTASNDKYGLSKTMSEPYDRDSLADDALVLLSAQMTDSAKAPALYTYQDLIQDCTFSGKQCSASDFTMYVDPVYGACFSFNEDKSLNYSTNREGIQYGLKLMLTVSQSTPSGINDYLPTTHMAGARLTVNSRGGRPSLEANGIDAGVGFQTAVAIVLQA
ncbi:unnamed protein product [Caenorhabditis auriculariae]|uniref:Uncharacterized protein n=1 Tax=Caenorhabditis auriculariae TaxID=2777116 RepID=A0A8S1GU50_9PELO|nr:unnamed protein product [Caenorhabditis auriculariae]